MYRESEVQADFYDITSASLLDLWHRNSLLAGSHLRLGPSLLFRFVTVV